jgi:hypothetical protein
MDPCHFPLSASDTKNVKDSSNIDVTVIHFFILRAPLQGLHRRLQERLRPEPSQTTILCAALKLEPRESRSLEPFFLDETKKTWLHPAPRAGLAVLPPGEHEA